ncbi:kinase-like domain-containing protein [Alternaria rosae]|uniref:kinase-like domain-containing protein n=1 Tax=Alternaria rosae TaxID=1187941 RepID=UPI001E8E4AF8|nr:kinase-like domain-containing protein [Alternaria rosae]KAH6857251.1 kinase-like domain-containing protein [Alternaria rosae]
MAFYRNSSIRLSTDRFCRLSPRTVQSPTAGSFCSKSTRYLAHCSRDEPAKLFEYTSGRWIWNDALKHSERRRVFDVSELKRLAAAAINQNVEDVTSFEKLAEGGFNRTFLITMRDGFQFVGRILYPVTEPKHLVVASEVATMDLLRLHGIPVPKIYSYSATSENAAGTEYIFMESIRGTNLGDIWFDLSGKARIAVVTKFVELESHLFALEFPASGSLYYTTDLPAGFDKFEGPIAKSARDGDFCIGPDTRLSMWYGKRGDLHIYRGPPISISYSKATDPTSALVAGAKKEIAYLTKFGRPLHPFQRVRREIYNYEKQSPLDHVASLEKYLQIAPYLIPHDNEALARPTLRHPDPQPNNIIVSDKLEITSLIDWQHCAILPLFLYSESLEVPELPPNFDDLSEREQFEQAVLLRRRQLHYYYIAKTAQLNSDHYNALAHDFSIVRRKLFGHASEPWEGDNVTLKADLIYPMENWSRITAPESSARGDSKVSCPISFTEDEVAECKRLHTAQIEADEQLQACRDVVGVGLEGWVPVEQYEETRQRERKLKADALAAAESEEERARLEEHWIFDDFDEEQYS